MKTHIFMFSENAAFKTLKGADQKNRLTHPKSDSNCPTVYSCKNEKPTCWKERERVCISEKERDGRDLPNQPV